MTKQVKVAFSIRNYHDEVLCNVVPMQASHILLVRPQLYDRNVNHNGQTNAYSLVMNGKQFTLKPLSPKDVSIMQEAMKTSVAAYEKSKRECESVQKSCTSKMRVVRKTMRDVSKKWKKESIMRVRVRKICKIT